MYTEQIDAQCSIENFRSNNNINVHWTNWCSMFNWKNWTKQIIQLTLNEINAQCSIENFTSNNNINVHWTKLMLTVQLRKLDQTYNINWHWTKLMLNVQFKN